MTLRCISLPLVGAICISLIVGCVSSFGLAPLRLPLRPAGGASLLQLSRRANDDGSDHVLRDGGVPTRRQLLRAGGISLAAFLMGQKAGPALAAGDGRPQTIVMTGANSGIGFEACKRLAAEGQHTIVMACRTLARAQEAAAELQKQTGGGKFLPAECNLASLASIRSFVGQLPNLLGDADAKVDVLCLNAGIARNTAATDCARTDDGFELTVGTNHFGHFYLNSLLLPSIRPSGKIVVTASSVHDPDGPGGAQGVPATLGNLQGLERGGKACEMIDGGAFNADKAYKDSKLCNVMFTRELQRRLEANDESAKGITANCFTPGLIVGTGLFRDQDPLFTRLFNFAATDLLKVGETPPWGGGCLAYMVDSVSDRGLFYGSDPGSSKYGDAAYGAQFKPVPVSKEARDDAKAKRLWELSERALGLA